MEDVATVGGNAYITFRDSNGVGAFVTNCQLPQSSGGDGSVLPASVSSEVSSGEARCNSKDVKEALSSTGSSVTGLALAESKNLYLFGVDSIPQSDRSTRGPGLP